MRLGFRVCGMGCRDWNESVSTIIWLGPRYRPVNFGTNPSTLVQIRQLQSGNTPGRTTLMRSNRQRQT